MTELLDQLTAALADRYAIERQLGEGGMATVYLAHDVKHNRKVAVKVLRPELSAILGGERFLKEIEVTANLQHPNILPLYDSGAADPFLYYVMPFVEGESLRDRLNREKQLAVDEAIEIARAVAGALDFAHQRGVVHRDIKPENILLQAGQALVADFGIALALSAAAGKGTRLTETGLSIGTPHYMSPEQASADRELDGRTDVYSLGAMLYEMLVGQPPFIAPSAQAIVAKILTEDPPPVSKDRASVPLHADAAIQQSLAKLPADRFTSAASFAAALVNPAFTRSTTVPGGAARSASRSPDRVKPIAWAVGMALVGAAVGFFVRGSNAPEAEVVRFGLAMPAGHRLNTQSNEDAPFAISPDGRSIVYVGLDTLGGGRLYIRRADQMEGVPVPGTDDGVAPFFSYDGLWIGFVTEADELLKKVPVTGGPAITLADDVANGAGSASWGDDGYIVYTSVGGGLSRVNGAGGASSESLIDTVMPGGMLWPSVLPGSKAVLFTHCEAQACTQSEVYLVDLETNTLTSLVPGGTQAWYASSGHLIYSTREGAVYGAPFDHRRGEQTGAPVPLLEGVRIGFFGSARMSISPSGDMIYLAGGSLIGSQIFEVDRSGRETVVFEDVGQYSHPRWSPSRDRIALTMSGDAGDQIWIYDVASGTRSQLTSEGTNARPSWSPDGTRVVFYSIREGEADIYWMPADRSMPAERLAEEDTDNVGTTFWTRDGEWIVFDGFYSSSNQDENIFAISTGDDRARRDVVATEAREETGAVSPNGEWVAYGSDESGLWQVYVRPFLAPGGRYLVSTGVAASPVWASDHEIVYADGNTSSLVAATLEFGTGVSVSARVPLFGLENYAVSQNYPAYDVSPDGQSFLVVRDASPRTDADAVVVLNWTAEIVRRMEQQGGR